MDVQKCAILVGSYFIHILSTQLSVYKANNYELHNFQDYAIKYFIILAVVH